LLLIALPVLLVLAVVVNLGSIKKIASGEKSLKGVIYGFGGGKGDGLMGWKLPPDTGAKDAKLTIEVFLHAGDPCHMPSAYLGMALGTVDPKRIRVTFVNAQAGAQAVARREQVKLGCEQGLAVNGKTEFQIPDPARGKGKKRTVFLAHQHDAGPMDPASGIGAVLDQELKAVYKGKGLGMTQDEFSAKLKAGMETAQVTMGAIMEAEKAAQEAKK
jgi:hypothetical protein